MRKILAITLSILLTFTIFTPSTFADINTNIDGGGGGLGQGSVNNGWAISADGGGLLFDADGLRVYVVNSSTGRPVSSVIDFTRYNVAKSNMINFNHRTKHDYLHVNSILSAATFYDYVKAPDSFPRIISNSMTADSSGDAARVNAIRRWFRSYENYEWIIGQFGFDLEAMQAEGYMLAIEPIAYFRYQGYNYAMTATEAALFDQLTGGALSTAMAPLTRKNLPLAIFLEEDEFTESPYRINEWQGTRNSNVPNTDIIAQLGIGYISYGSGDDGGGGGGDNGGGGSGWTDNEGGFDFSYPADTWVVTSFRLCSVRRSGGSWVPGTARTAFNPASARVTINGTTYNVSNIYMPAGGEQLFWIKWKTPAFPVEITATVTSSTGMLYNINSTDVSNRYVNSLTASINIYDNDMENPPPDPTLNDTMSSIGYTATGAATGRNNLMRGAAASNSWSVWDCNWQRISSSSRWYDWWDVPPDTYNSATGIYTQYEFVRDNFNFTRELWRETNYRIQFNRITYTAEIRNSYVRIKPDVNCPTAYTRNNRTFMKSGYGINVEIEPYIRVTTHHSGTGVRTTNNYFAPATTDLVAAPQYVFAYFPEFRYTRFNRQLDYVNNRFEFRQNQFSTYNERTHYTPWWFPDNTNYEIVTRSDFAYTPAGRLRMFQVSDLIVIEGNLMEDWRVAPVR
ncbi:MAG: hypothetical protein FWD48_03870 [Oscillospiraceae bacterium]|nr:hypothetical protein [Oscillospiraceae bacterium]